MKPNRVTVGGSAISDCSMSWPLNSGLTSCRRQGWEELLLTSCFCFIATSFRTKKGSTISSFGSLRTIQKYFSCFWFFRPGRAKIQIALLGSSHRHLICTHKDSVGTTHNLAEITKYVCVSTLYWIPAILLLPFLSMNTVRLGFSNLPSSPSFSAVHWRARLNISGKYFHKDTYFSGYSFQSENSEWRKDMTYFQKHPFTPGMLTERNSPTVWVQNKLGIQTFWCRQTVNICAFGCHSGRGPAYDIK